MACRLIKKGLVGAALGAGALALLFGTAAPSYVKTAFHKVRHNAKSAVPIQFQIDRARQQVADLEPAIHINRENIASAEVDVERLEREILASQANLSQEKREIVALRGHLDSGDLRLVGRVSYTPDEIKTELSRRMDRFKVAKQIVKEKEDTLKARQKAVIAARKQLAEMTSAKQSLLVKIDEIEARLKSIEATQAANEFTFDDSELARVKESVSDLEKRVEVMARVAEQEGRLADKSVPVLIEPTRDVLKEIDAEFGTGTGTNGYSTTITADKSF
jgi:chromosome segregation ATPase